MLPSLLSAMMSYYNDTALSQHAVKVFAYANVIGMGESLPENDQLILWAASILHDIGIPNAIKLHGSPKGEFQEKEGALLVPGMLENAGFSGITEHVAWLVGHHHTKELAASDILLQILMEADYLVNLAEGNHTREKAVEVRDTFFKTKTGIELISSLFSI